MERSKDRTLRIIHILPENPYPVISGAARHVMELAQAQAELGMQVTVIGFTSARNRSQSKLGLINLQLFPYLTLIRQHPINPLSFGFLPILGKADIIHCHQPRTLVIEMALICGKLLGKKVFITSHGGGASITLSRLYDPMQICDKLVANSNFSRQVFSQNPKLLSKHLVVPGGVNTQRFTPDLKVRRERKVFYSGRLYSNKGVNYLLEAVSLLNDPTINLVITASRYDVQYLKDLQAQAQDLKLSVQWVRPDDEELTEHYRTATVTVLPSVYTDVYGGYSDQPELLGLVLLESMACGTPVICTRVGGMPEFVVDGETGFVVAPNDPAQLAAKLAILLNNATRANQMGQQGLKIVRQNYSWGFVAHKLLEIYKGCPKVKETV